ncbi:MAG: hypothetical protein COY40_06840 [Alphaproteobacteria bacterium CG_4_10_14_0_8_um_filter_53_9]|nr:MAG: hypothetical protein COY40_06840 [Alphaproteobacteria bacterium CG_4_10_14_0_8_um_filter_53_9]
MKLSREPMGSNPSPTDRVVIKQKFHCFRGLAGVPKGANVSRLVGTARGTVKIGERGAMVASYAVKWDGHEGEYVVPVSNLVRAQGR